MPDKIEHLQDCTCGCDSDEKEITDSIAENSNDKAVVIFLEMQLH